MKMMTFCGDGKLLCKSKTSFLIQRYGQILRCGMNFHSYLVLERIKVEFVFARVKQTLDFAKSDLKL